MSGNGAKQTYLRVSYRCSEATLGRTLDDNAFSWTENVDQCSVWVDGCVLPTPALCRVCVRGRSLLRLLLRSSRRSTRLVQIRMLVACSVSGLWTIRLHANGCVCVRWRAFAVLSIFAGVWARWRSHLRGPGTASKVASGEYTTISTVEFRLDCGSGRFALEFSIPACAVPCCVSGVSLSRFWSC